MLSMLADMESSNKYRAFVQDLEAKLLAKVGLHALRYTGRLGSFAFICLHAQDVLTFPSGHERMKHIM